MVTCNEHDLGPKLPAYTPDDPAGWAIKAAGVVQQLKILRGSTAACLDNYRKRGVII